MPDPTLPEVVEAAEDPVLPEAILDRRTINREGEEVAQALVKWRGVGTDDATWMDIADLQGQFPYFSLEDKAVLTGEAVDTPPWRVFRRGKRRVVWPDSKAEERESSC